MGLSKSFVIGAGTTPLDARMFEQSLVTKNVNDTPRPGVLYGGLGPLATTATMALTIGDQTVFVVTRGKTDGCAFVLVSGTYTIPIDPAPAANSRIDVVYIKHNDTSQGDADSNPVIGVVKGDAAASPSPKPIPAGASQIGTFQVAAGVTATNAASGATLTNTILATSLSGAPVRYRNLAEMNTDLPNVIDGTLGYIKGGDLYYVRGGAWTLVSNGDTGWIALAVPSTMTGIDVAYRRVNGVVYLKGQVSVKTGTFSNGYTDFATLPAGFRPVAYNRVPIGMFNGYTALLTVNSSGVMTIGASADRTADTVYLGGVSFPAS
jgi:hypothetical protein